MANWRPITFLDTWPSLIGLWKNRNTLTAGFGDSPLQTLDLRMARNAAEPDTFADMPILEDWKGMRALLQRATRGLGIRPLGAARIEMLPAGTAEPWSSEAPDAAARIDRFALALTTNPGCWCYCGSETMHLPIGHLYWMNAGAMHSASNFGDHPRYHLVFDLLKESP